MRYLLTGDLHLTDRAKDEYRFGVFPWLNEQQKKYNVDATFLLGDLTDKKDCHSAKLVNRIISELGKLTKPVIILKGNHDYIDPENPFFRFLDVLNGVAFVSKPESIEGVMCIPHIRDENEFVKACHDAKATKPDYLFLHQCIDGAVSESGAPLTGFKTSAIADVAPRYGCYAGDIHKPQKVGPVQYVGAPYHIRFGDNFDPRALLLDNGKEVNLYYECPRKWAITIRGPEDILRNKALFEGDQIKLTVEMTREEAGEWKSVKAKVIEACKQKGLEVTGPDLKISGLTIQRDRISTEKATPRDVVASFCNVEKLSQARKQVGLDFVRV